MSRQSAVNSKFHASIDLSIAYIVKHSKFGQFNHDKVCHMQFAATVSDLGRGSLHHPRLSPLSGSQSTIYCVPQRCNCRKGMSAFGGARGAPAKPPEKGIFPLDHFGECKQVTMRGLCLRRRLCASRGAGSWARNPLHLSRAQPRNTAGRRRRPQHQHTACGRQRRGQCTGTISLLSTQPCHPRPHTRWPTSTSRA